LKTGKIRSRGGAYLKDTLQFKIVESPKTRGFPTDDPEATPDPK